MRWLSVRFIVPAVVLALLGAGCARSKGDRILADQKFFGNGFVSAAAKYAREDCEAFKAKVGSLPNPPKRVSSSANIIVPRGREPKLAEIAAKYGRADLVSGDVHFYADVGLRVRPDGTIGEVVIECRVK